MARIKNISARLVVFVALFFMVGHTAFAGTLRKPPNNLGLVAYWPFDEGDGLVAGDASGNGHTGTFSVTINSAWTSGKLGNALNATNLSTGGSTNKVAFSNITTGTTNTISMWVYLTGNCTSYGSLFDVDGQAGLYCLSVGGVNKIDFYTANDHYNNTALALNQWYHVVVVSNAGSGTFYLNGVADGTIASLPSINANVIGNDSSGEIFHGKIDEVRLYNRALSASDIYALYKSGTTRISNTTSYKSPGTLANGLTSYYTFDGKDMVRNVADVTGQRNARLVGYTSTTTVPGKVGQALTFNGTNNYVNGAAIGNYLSSATGTVSVWLRPTGNPNNFSNAGAVYDAQAAVSCSCLASFGISRGNKQDTSQDRIWVWAYTTSLIGIPYITGEWAHITLVHANGTLYAYKNGDFVGSIAAGNFSNFSGTLTIGTAWTGTGGYWNGDLDEVRTYNRDLSASEIKQLYNLTLGTKVNKPSVNSLTNGLVGYWTFDGGDTDWSTNTVVNRGSVGGTGAFWNMGITTSPIQGKIGQGLNFNGTNSYVVLNNLSTLKVGTGSYSVSFWYKGLKGSAEVFMQNFALFQPWWWVSNTKAEFNNVGIKDVTKNYTLPNDNGWHHLAVVLNRTPSPDTLEVYIDGISQGAVSGTLDGENIAPAVGPAIGLQPGGNEGYRQGPMDEVRIYNRTLSAAEVLQLYHMGK